MSGLAEKAATGGWVTLTTMYEVAESVAPLSSTTVRRTRKVPGCPNRCWTTLPLPLEPSPKSQTYDRIAPSGSLELVPLNVIESPGLTQDALAGQLARAVR